MTSAAGSAGGTASASSSSARTGSAAGSGGGRARVGARTFSTIGGPTGVAIAGKVATHGAIASAGGGGLVAKAPAALYFPNRLPCPQQLTISPAERRALDSEQYPTQAATRERYRRMFERVVWPELNEDRAALFDQWWTADLVFGGAWFWATWPCAQGLVPIERHFIAPPEWTYRAGGFWRVSALIETRAPGSVPVYEGTGVEIGWLELVEDPDGVAAHANAGDGDLGAFALGNGWLHAGVVGYAGQSVTWSVASWTPTMGGSSPVLTDLGGGKVRVEWQNIYGTGALGELVLTATIDGTPIAVGQRLVATVIPDTGVDGYSQVAWGPE